MPMIIMLVVMVGMIFFMQRQQKKQAQDRQNQLNAIQKGDEVVTIGGLYGIVDEVDTDNKKLVLDVDGVYLTFELAAVKRVTNKAAAAETASEEAPAEEAPAVESQDQVEVDSAIDSKD
ncbi:preprotein translocase subunit YajC [Streptococcus caballi]|uniref:preprotein translocase subunit YajC n=1 Tax=Streptococcus caballi TaxID=439220 RepID=UPI00037414D1|nr:preprotein translocase subunit YajC [Streptococcus caballi]